MPCPLRPLVGIVLMLLSVVWAVRALLRQQEQVKPLAPNPPVHLRRVSDIGAVILACPWRPLGVPSDTHAR